MLNTYMTEDQRFAATRPDVLVYKTEPLDHDVTVFGPISVDLKVSTTGTDSDFVVKLIDVYPGDFPDYNASRAGAAARRDRCRGADPMGGYQQLVRGEPFRGKFRKSFEKPVPFEPGKPDRITFTHAGHRAHVPRGASDHGADSELLVPADGPQSAEVHGYSESAVADFVKATQRVYFGRRGRIEDRASASSKLLSITRRVRLFAELNQ